MTNLTPGDLDICARTLWAEGRGEDYVGKLAIMHAIINRTNKHIGDRDHSLAATAIRHMQFSGWNESDLNRKKIENVTLNNASFRECMRAVLEALDEPDFTFGSDHYHTHASRPRWSRGKKPTYKHGNHRFFNNID